LYRQAVQALRFAGLQGCESNKMYLLRASNKQICTACTALYHPKVGKGGTAAS